MTTDSTIRFFHGAGHASVRSELDSLIGSATSSFQGAVCFFTQAGFVLLRQHSRILNQQNSFFVASVDFPTDIDALHDLYQCAPGHVFIHLGGKTPDEKRVGRALMHSKVLLATSDERNRLWVGSHNMTGQAILGGNIEAGVQIVASSRDPVIVDAAAHLEVCRAMAEPFDPARIERYREIQNRRLDPPPWLRPDRLLVLHAEATSTPRAAPFTVHLRVGPTDFDKYFINDREIRLYLHKPGGLRRGLPADFTEVPLWSGSITGVVRTARHPRNVGVQGNFAAADFELTITNETDPPVFDRPGSTSALPTTQVLIRMDAQRPGGSEIYSISGSPATVVYDAEEAGQELDGVDHDMRKFFKTGSIRAGNLVFRPVKGVRHQIKVRGYEETMRTTGDDDGGRDSVLGMPEVMYESKNAPRPVDAFIFLTKHVIDRTRQ